MCYFPSRVVLEIPKDPVFKAEEEETATTSTGAGDSVDAGDLEADLPSAITLLHT